MLHLGEIKWWYSCIEIAQQFAGMKDRVLFFHGYHDRDYLAMLKSSLTHNGIKNVIISEEIYDSMDDTDKLVKSCDIGIAWYNDITTGFRTVGRSSGKISAYLRFGLPVVATRYPSTVDAVEKAGCGVCIDRYDEIEGALARIEEDYEMYSANAIAEYDKTYWFENYKKALLNFIDEGSVSQEQVCETAMSEQA